MKRNVAPASGSAADASERLNPMISESWAPDASRLVTLDVPAGVAVGQVFNVSTQFGTFGVIVPEGAVTGTKIRVNVPPHLLASSSYDAQQLLQLQQPDFARAGPGHVKLESDEETAQVTSCVYCGALPNSDGAVPSPSPRGATAGAGAAPAASATTDGARTRKRRKLKDRDARKELRMCKWWKGFGYAGERYCQRCGEVFRDHLILEKSNSAQCTRENPCSDCVPILRNFPFDKSELWSR